MKTDQLVADTFRDLIVQGFACAIPGHGARPTGGSLSRLVEQLVLETTLSYEAIVAKVREQFPDANTSTKSVASVACVMRKKGQPVPLRIKFNH